MHPGPPVFGPTDLALDRLSGQLRLGVGSNRPESELIGSRKAREPNASEWISNSPVLTLATYWRLSSL